jgi:hypothetical protein
MFWIISPSSSMLRCLLCLHVFITQHVPLRELLVEWGSHWWPVPIQTTDHWVHSSIHSSSSCPHWNKAILTAQLLTVTPSGPQWNRTLLTIWFCSLFFQQAFSETMDTSSILTRVIAWEDFIDPNLYRCPLKWQWPVSMEQSPWMAGNYCANEQIPHCAWNPEI